MMSAAPSTPRTTPRIAQRPRAPRPWCAAALVLVAAACTPGQGSMTLTWPNEEVRGATKQLAVFAFTADTGAGRQQCKELLQRLPKGDLLARDPFDNPFDYAAAAGTEAFERSLSNFPVDPSVVMIVGYNDPSADLKKPIVQGCTEGFGSRGKFDLELPLDLVLPSGVAVFRARGDRQVGRPGALLPEPLVVKVDAWVNMAMTSPDKYPMPGVPITVKTTPDVKVAGQAGEAVVITNADGLAEIPVEMPSASGLILREIEVSSARLTEACRAENPANSTIAEACRTATQKKFSVSAIGEEIQVDTQSVGSAPIFDVLTGIGVGQVNGGSRPDLVLLGCRGSASGCAEGRQLVAPLGEARLALVTDLGGPNTVTLPDAMPPMGLAPGGVYVGPLVPGAGDEVAVLNSRRQDCAARGCEASEFRVFSGDGAGLRLIAQETLTASNAVGITGLRRTANASEVETIVTAAQGSTRSGRPCPRNQMCLPEAKYSCPAGAPSDCVDACYLGRSTGVVPPQCVDSCLEDSSDCGCPLGEQCICPPGQNCLRAEPGICVPQDRILDRLTSLAVRSAGESGFENLGGCHEPVAACRRLGTGMPEMRGSACGCRDTFRGNTCSKEGDPCSCLQPGRILIGSDGAVTVHDLAAGQLRDTYGPDLVAASDDGVEFFQPPDGNGPLRWTLRRIPARRVVGVRITQFLERQGPSANLQDVLWWTREPCGAAVGDEDACPVTGADPVGPEPMTGGCFGTYLRDSTRTVIAIREDGCRRYRLETPPAGACVADFNADGTADVAFSSYESATVQLFLGDGRGGLLNPPISVTLAGPGGQLVCPDLDADGRADLVTSDRGGRVQLARIR